MSKPTTFFRADCSRCVAVWWERMRRRSATSTEAVTWEGEGGEAGGGEDQSMCSLMGRGQGLRHGA